jgi:Fic family protein
VQSGGEFSATLWREWLTAELIARLGLNDRQRKGMLVAQLERRLTNARYQAATGAKRDTAKRDLDGLVTLGLLIRRGSGRGAHYEVPPKWRGNGANGASPR